jgi:CHAT domain-containing protein
VEEEVVNVCRRHFADATGRALATIDRETLLALDPKVGLLHLACHADRNGVLVGSPGKWVSLAELSGLRLQADILLLTGCHAGLLLFDDSSEFSGVVRELLVATGARTAVVSRAAVPETAGPIFADLFVTAITTRGDNASRGPSHPLAVAEAVSWASRSMRELPKSSLQSLLRPPVGIVLPSRPAWWSPWLVIGDPATFFTQDGETH